MNKFTRGPWKQYHLKNHINILDDKDYCVTSICKVDSNGESDAALIAVAPDMFKLLMFAKCPECDGSGGKHDCNGMPCECQWCHETKEIFKGVYNES